MVATLPLSPSSASFPPFSFLALLSSPSLPASPLSLWAVEVFLSLGSSQCSAFTQLHVCLLGSGHALQFRTHVRLLRDLAARISLSESLIAFFFTLCLGTCLH